MKADATGIEMNSSARAWHDFHGWRIVGAGAVISAVGSALVLHGFASYAVLLRKEFDIEPALVTGPATDNDVGVQQIGERTGLTAINALVRPVELGDKVAALLSGESS